ncbi:MAG: hypothetical protein LUG55_08140 [Clostridiales bacterium]|nr:hypothetical protein [Clostridiales bacterium]
MREQGLNKAWNKGIQERTEGRPQGSRPAERQGLKEARLKAQKKMLTNVTRKGAKMIA